ncbi:hypothetical protein D9M68_841090 [compost metagenome]
MQDFHLAQRRVGNVQLQRAVIVTQRQTLVRQAGAQAQDVVLQGLQQAVVAQVGVFRVNAELLATFGRGQGEQAVEKVAALLAEARQQRVADIQVPVVRA